MTDYYCDLAEDFVDRSGADGTTNVLTGPGGFQNALTGDGAATALAAGDTLYLTGTADLSKLVTVTVDADKSGTWVIGDVVQNHNDGGGASGDDWVGRLVFIDATTIVVQIDDASTNYSSVATADGIDNTTRTETLDGANMTAKACVGIPVATAAGTGGLPIYFVGTPASWSEDGTRAVLDGNDLATQCILIAGYDYYMVRNVDFMQATGAGVYGSSASSILIWIFSRCDSHDNGTSGWDTNGKTFSQCLWVGCRGYDNTAGSGISDMVDSVAIGCQFYGNLGASGHGVGNGGPYRNTFHACIFRDNAGDGFGGSSVGGDCFTNCVFDNNAGNGLDIGNLTTLFRCRITNHTTAGKYGIAIGTGTAHIIQCYFNGNTIGDTNGTSAVSTFAGADTTVAVGLDGYRATASDDYNTILGAAGYRLTLDTGDGLNYVVGCAGLPSLIIPRVGGVA